MSKLGAAIFGFSGARSRGLLHRFRRDQSGNYLIISGLLMPVLVGFVCLGTDVTLWLYKHRAMQAAADSAAFSAATAYMQNVKDLTSLQTQAWSAAGSYGFVNGSNGVNVTLNWPYDSRPGSVEVIVAQPQTPLFASLFLSSLTISARAVAVGTPQVAGTGCVLALDQTAGGAVTTQGSATVNLTGCSLASNSNSDSALTVGGSSYINALSVSVVGLISGSPSHIDASGGILTKQVATTDPYAGASICVQGQTPCPPTPCNLSDQTFQSTVTIGPPRQTPQPSPYVPASFVLCGPTKLNSGAVVTLRPGIYYLEEDSSGKAGSLTVNGGATLQSYDAYEMQTYGTLEYCAQNDCGVTLVFTSSSGNVFGAATINGGATVKLTAPKSGPTAGIEIFGDRRMPTGMAFQFNGGSTQIFNGAIYLPKAAASFSGGSGTSNACTQLVADTVTFTGNSNFKIGCAGMTPIGATPASVSLIQ